MIFAHALPGDEGGETVECITVQLNILLLLSEKGLDITRVLLDVWLHAFSLEAPGKEDLLIIFIFFERRLRLERLPVYLLKHLYPTFYARAVQDNLQHKNQTKAHIKNITTPPI